MFPAFKAIRSSFGYFISQAPTIIKILWAPAALMMAAQLYFTPKMVEAQFAMIDLEAEGADPSLILTQFSDMLPSIGALYLVMAIAFPMMIAGLLRSIVRGETPSLPFYLRYGGDELRVLVAFILLIILVMIIYLVGAVAVFAITAVSSLAGGTIAGVLSGVAMLVFFGGMVWFLVRMSLVYAAGVDGKTLGIAQSWAMTKGSFFGLFFFWIVIMVVMALFLLLFVGVSMPGYFADMYQLIQAADDPGAAAEIEKRMIDAQIALYDLSKPAGWLYAAATYVMTIVSTAIWVAASGIAYRYLKEAA